MEVRYEESVDPETDWGLQIALPGQEQWQTADPGWSVCRKTHGRIIHITMLYFTPRKSA